MEAKDIAQLGVAAAMLAWFAVRFERVVQQLVEKVTALIIEVTKLVKEVAEARGDVKEITGRHEIPPELRGKRGRGE